ncbi:MAG: RNA-binding protein [Flavobacteriaceae bacterium]|nr:RNA-binding protein [Flavobacteriaceae bacterium]
MRIDKFLWCVRYFKTRTMATNACKKGLVKINGKSVKPSHKVYPNEKITLRIHQINFQLTILDLPKSRMAAKLIDIYRVDTTPKLEFEAREFLKYSKDCHSEKEKGRPTKKNRRDIENYIDFNDN